MLRLSVQVLGRIFESLQLATIAFVWLQGVKVKRFTIDDVRFTRVDREVLRLSDDGLGGFFEKLHLATISVHW